MIVPPLKHVSGVEAINDHQPSKESQLWGALGCPNPGESLRHMDTRMSKAVNFLRGVSEVPPLKEPTVTLRLIISNCRKVVLEEGQLL
jgi:hypothetical protein